MSLLGRLYLRATLTPKPEPNPDPLWAAANRRLALTEAHMRALLLLVLIAAAVRVVT